MLVAIILLCPAFGPCDRLILPGHFASPVLCLMHGEAYVAETALDLKGKTIRVVCKQEVPPKA